MEYKPMSPYEKCVRTIKREIEKHEIETSWRLADVDKEQLIKLINLCADMTEATINYCEILGIE